MFKLRLLTAAAAAAFLAGAATAQTMPQQTTPGAEEKAKAGKATKDAAKAAAAREQAMKGAAPADQSHMAPPAEGVPPATPEQSAQTQAQPAMAEAGTSKEGMSERTTRAWSDMNMQETTVGTSRLFTSTSTDETGRTMTIVTNGPVPDNAENRAQFTPLSNAGRRSAARGN